MRNMSRFFAILLVGLCTSFYLYEVGRGGVSPLMSLIVGVSLTMVMFVVWGVEYLTTDNQRARKQVPKKTGGFDWGMHYFRGFAIVCIMLLHFVGAFRHLDCARALLGASTIYFLFISGYLCQYLDLKKPTQASVYYKKKLQNVILPYVVCSLMTVIAMCVIGTPRHLVFAMGDMSLIRIVKGLCFGSMQYQYWYIPFVTFLFAISPLILRLATPMLVGVTLLAGGVMVCFPVRGTVYPLAWPNTFYLYSYFTVFYLIGFVYARCKTSVDPYLRKYVCLSLLFAITLAVALYFPGVGGLKLVSTDLAVALQRFSTMLVVIVALQKIKDKRIAILDAFAKYSFTLFFIHMFFIQDFLDIALRFRGIVWELVFIPAYLLLLLGISALLKMALGKSSRMFIGS